MKSWTLPWSKFFLAIVLMVVLKLFSVPVGGFAFLLFNLITDRFGIALSGSQF